MTGMVRCCRPLCLIFLFFLLTGCGPEIGDKEAKLFDLEKILTIDTEESRTAEAGLTDIAYFDSDSKGNFYIANLKSKENYLFALNQDGDLISAFGSRGQGPGEFQSPKELIVSPQDEIFITDAGKVSVFSPAGEFLKDIRIDSDYQKIIPLDQDKYLAIAVRLNEDLSQSFQVILCSSDMTEIKILDSSKIESFEKATKVNIIPTLVHWDASNRRIFTGHTDEYEIRVFDFDGNLLKRIRKDYQPVPLSDTDRERYEKNLQRYPPEIKESFYIPETFPPFQNLAVLGDTWLFVQTYEKSAAGLFLYDVFDPDGEFEGRAELEGDRVKFKGDRVYCLKQKASGYRELVVYRMIRVL